MAIMEVTNLPRLFKPTPGFNFPRGYECLSAYSFPEGSQYPIIIDPVDGEIQGFSLPRPEGTKFPPIILTPHDEHIVALFLERKLNKQVMLLQVVYENVNVFESSPLRLCGQDYWPNAYNEDLTKEWLFFSPKKSFSAEEEEEEQEGEQSDSTGTIGGEFWKSYGDPHISRFLDSLLWQFRFFCSPFHKLREEGDECYSPESTAGTASEDGFWKRARQTKPVRIADGFPYWKRGWRFYLGTQDSNQPTSWFMVEYYSTRSDDEWAVFKISNFTLRANLKLSAIPKTGEWFFR